MDAKKAALLLIKVGCGILIFFLVSLLPQVGLFNSEFSKFASSKAFSAFFFLIFLDSIISKEAFARGLVIKKEEHPVMYYSLTCFFLIVSVAFLIITSKP